MHTASPGRMLLHALDLTELKKPKHSLLEPYGKNTQLLGWWRAENNRTINTRNQS